MRTAVAGTALVAVAALGGNAQAAPVRVRYLPGTGTWSGAVGVAAAVASQVTPTSLDGDFHVTPFGSSMALTVDDVGVLDSQTVAVVVTQAQARGEVLRWRRCVPVRQRERFAGLTPGRVATVSVLKTDGWAYVMLGECTGRAAGGTASVEGAAWTPYGADAGRSAYPEASGCSVSTAGLLPGDTGACRFTATAAGGWVETYDGVGVSAGDYTTDVSLDILRNGRHLHFSGECASARIRRGDRVTASIRQYETGYSQHTLHAGSDAGC